jgi:hypothetical protein
MPEDMSEQRVIERAREDAREGKSPSTQAGEFVREEIEHIREGKHGARSAKQAIAIGLSKARRAGVPLPPPEGSSSAKVRRKAAEDTRRGSNPRRRPSKKRSRATSETMRRESARSASAQALSRQARTAARRRGEASRRSSALRAARTRQRTRGRR